jgi:DNA polymerase V
MDALDGLNARYGRDKISLASAGIDKPWSTAFDYRTPRFTTSWDDLAIAYA